MFQPRIISQGDGLSTQGTVQEQLSRLVSEKPNTRTQVDQPTTQDTTKEVFISVLTSQDLTSNLKEFLKIPKYK